MLTKQQITGDKFVKLVEVMKRLRAIDGCPWDREQDYFSLRRYIIEEAYELIEAIENKDRDNTCEECGDLMLQVVFIACMAEELGDFDICEVIDHLTEKLIRRHPHVFGDTEVNDSEDVLKNWEQIKVGERKERKVDASLLAGVPRGLPGLLRAYRIQERAQKVGFDWPKDDLTPVLAKVDEELLELKENIKNGAGKEYVEEEIGDLLFAVTNLSRHLEANPETTLHKACVKFSDRFRLVEKEVADSGKSWNDFTLDELEGFWSKAKDAEKRE